MSSTKTENEKFAIFNKLSLLCEEGFVVKANKAQRKRALLTHAKNRIRMPDERSALAIKATKIR